ncbi:MAG TPA: ferritin family protein [Geobacteraceae bacterium]|nr:ferritin family protein [Geobacteraceae bacterium]
MGKEYTVQEALKLAIRAEKGSMDFYRRAAAVTRNQRAKRVFELLANEEVGHLKSFYDLYKGGELGGDLKEYMAFPPDRKNVSFHTLEKAIDEETHEQKALEIALKEEKGCIDQYSILVQDIVDPLVRGIFMRILKETQKHYDMIEEEYRHVMTMVHAADQDIYVRE